MRRSSSRPNIHLPKHCCRRAHGQSSMTAGHRPSYSCRPLFLIGNRLRRFRSRSTCILCPPLCPGCWRALPCSSHIQEMFGHRFAQTIGPGYCLKIKTIPLESKLSNPPAPWNIVTSVTSRGCGCLQSVRFDDFHDYREWGSGKCAATDAYYAWQSRFLKGVLPSFFWGPIPRCAEYTNRIQIQYFWKYPNYQVTRVTQDPPLRLS